MELQVQQDLKEEQVDLAQQVQQDHKVYKEQLDQQDQQDLKEEQVDLVQQDQLDLQAHKDLLVLLEVCNKV